MYPIIHPIEPFDSSVGTEIKFSWKGNQIFKVRCFVKNNETGVTVYDHIESTMKQSYSLPPNSGLLNGIYYVAYITVLDINNNESDLQEIGTPFYCLSKPLFNLSVSDGELIQTSAYKVGLNYSQSQGEQLDSYSFTLYTYQKTVFSSSGDIYNTSDMSYVISGLENAKQYYIRATGKTLHGITLDTGFILITISYTIAQVFNTLELNNKAESGAVEIKSNIVSAIGLSEKDVIYIGDEYADLRDNSVTFDEGFEVRGDFTKIFVFYEPERNKSIISFGDGDRLKVDIYYRIGKYADSNGEKAYFELVANSCGINYVMNSNYVDIPNADYQQFALLVNRIGAYYDLKVVVISTVIRYSANADGSNMTETKQANSQYVGIGYIPGKILEHENILTNSVGNRGDLNGWYNDNASNLNFNLISINGEPAIELIDKRIPTGAQRIYVRKHNFTSDIIRKGLGKITVSFKYKASLGSKNSGIGVMLRASTPENPYTDIISPLSQPIIDDQWHNISITGDLSILIGKEFNNSINFYLFTYAGTVTYRDLKFEYGDTATSWTPAPSDWVADPNNYTWKPL